MTTVNVLLVNRLERETRERLRAVSPGIRLLSSLPGWEAPNTPAGICAETDARGLDSLLARSEVIFGYRPPDNVVARAPRLKWIHTALAGVDHLLTKELVQSRVVVTNSSGIHAVQVTELVFEKMLRFVKQATRFAQYQHEKKWERHILGRLHGKTLGIVSLGSIGRAVAQMGKAFGMRVVATRRSTRHVSRARHVDVLYPRPELGRLMAESDFVVLTLPRTPETDRMIGEKELRRMKPTAFLVNVGRGETIDEEALVLALRENWIAGAGLDAYAVEPLPASSPLWDLPNVILTPHVGGPIENYLQRAADLFAENLDRYVAGRRLFNVVDKKQGY